tara:strand:+ start:228 stop:905 length:678 start_codon:yes stop_codon:yes gene_type:complete
MSETSKIIAIDGPAASGKGTLARELAAVLNFAHMDTGALYRAVGYEVLQAGGDLENAQDALAACRVLEEKLAQGDPLSNPDLRLDEIGNAASKVAVMESVRAALIDIQRHFAQNPADTYEGAVLDGRDIGTVICSDAHLKLYVTANMEIRAKRRMKELQSKGINVKYGAVLEDMRARDARDSGRKAAPLRPAQDAIVIDTSTLTQAQMLEMALEYAKKAFVGNTA